LQPKADSSNPPGILLVAPPDSYRVAPYLEAAQKLGVPITIVSSGKHSLINEIAAGIHIDLNQPASAIKTIVDSASRHPICGIVAGDDLVTEIVAHAAQALNLPHNPPDAVHFTRWKHKARAILKQAGLPVPDFWTIALNQAVNGQLPDIDYPCVIKPLNLSASRGVIRCDNRDELIKACRRVAAIVAPFDDDITRSIALVENFIPGQEIAVEAILENGKLTPIAIFDKPDPLNGPYFEETYYVTPSRHPETLQQKAIAIVQQACKVYGLTTGPVHAELRLDQHQPYIIEIAARTIGGECARLLEYASGQSLEALVLQFAMGKPQAALNLNKAAGVMMIPTPRSGILRRVEGTLEAQKVNHIDAVQLAIREGHELITLPEGASYLGFIFASAESPTQVECALREAYSKLNVVVSPLWKIAGKPHGE